MAELEDREEEVGAQVRDMLKEYERFGPKMHKSHGHRTSMIFKCGNQPASKICALSKTNKTSHRIRILNVLCPFV